MAGGDTVLLEAEHERGGVLAAGPSGEMVVELVLIAPARERVREVLVAAPGGIAHDTAEGLPLLVGGNGNGDPAVFTLAGVAAVGGHPAVPVAQRALDAAVHGVVHDGV